jgi:exonuclease VII small subunit
MGWELYPNPENPTGLRKIYDDRGVVRTMYLPGAVLLWLQTGDEEAVRRIDRELQETAWLWRVQAWADLNVVEDVYGPDAGRSLPARITQLEKLPFEVTEQLVKHAERIEKLTATVATYEQRVKKLEGVVDALEAGLLDHDRWAATTKFLEDRLTRLERLTSTVAVFEARLTRLEEIVDVVTHAFDVEQEAALRESALGQSCPAPGFVRRLRDALSGETGQVVAK